MAKVNLAAPWTTFYRQVQAFFKKDPEIKVMYNAQGPELKLYVDNPVKAEALTQLLEPTKTFGNVVLTISVVPSNKAVDGDMPEMNNDIALIKAALAGNGAISGITDITGVMCNPITYVSFKKEVVQFFNDNLSDLHGLTSTLYQDLADVIFTHHLGVCFCTDAANGFGAPLGEWP
jgi:hypothetical protein